MTNRFIQLKEDQLQRVCKDTRLELNCTDNCNSQCFRHKPKALLRGLSILPDNQEGNEGVLREGQLQRSRSGLRRGRAHHDRRSFVAGRQCIGVSPH